MKILTVEDDNMIREGISEYLSEFGLNNLGLIEPSVRHG